MSDAFPPLLKAMLLQELYNNSKPQGMGMLRFVPGDMPLDMALELIERQQNFDYVAGRVIKVNFDRCATPSDVVGRLYDRDIGEGSFDKCFARARERYAEARAEKARD